MSTPTKYDSATRKLGDFNLTNANVGVPISFILRATITGTSVKVEKNLTLTTEGCATDGSITINPLATVTASTYQVPSSTVQSITLPTFSAVNSKCAKALIYSLAPSGTGDASKVTIAFDNSLAPTKVNF